MAKIRDALRHAVPWLDPFLEYFDWRKRVTAGALTIIIAGWSFVKDLSAPVIITLALTVLVQTAYLLIFPAFVRLVHKGVKSRPNHSIWKHKKQFELYQAAGLLADSEPVGDSSQMDADSRAWFELLCDAVEMREIARLASPYDERRTASGKFIADENTAVTAEELKKFCAARGRQPEFLAW